jgi:hypothetical protein
MFHFFSKNSFFGITVIDVINIGACYSIETFRIELTVMKVSNKEQFFWIQLEKSPA